ncbi:MAG: carbon-nitrogen hydrolase family protein [Longimicrobiales bacterium]
MRFAAAQTVPEPGDVQGNVEQHMRFVELAAREQVDVLLFPELSLTGYELELGHRLAFSADDDRLAPLIGLARANAITLIVGAPIASGSYVTIGAFICHPDGTVGLYNKRHLGSDEELAFMAGEPTPLVQLGGVPAALAICADASHPSHAEEAAQLGARSYLVSAFVTPEDLPRKVERLVGYAKLHTMPVVFANYGGPSGGLPSGGSSAIWSDTGALVAQLTAEGPGLVMASSRGGVWVGRTVNL